jgi:GntR family transcriptional regulator, gluconate operon transcriptional repressor
VTSQTGPELAPDVLTGRAPLRPIDLGRSLAENAADRIREQVLIGGYSQGQHLVEAKIAEELRISRGPVREAFKMLRAEGLVTEEPRRGTFVVSITPQDVRDIYGLRAAVEGAAAKLLCRSGDPAALAQLDEAAEAIGVAAADGEAAGAGADLAFHEKLCELSGNARLLETFRRYVPMLRGLLRLDERVMPSIEYGATEHRPMVEAIRRGDEAEAVRLVTEHSERAGERLADLLEHGE